MKSKIIISKKLLVTISTFFILAFCLLMISIFNVRIANADTAQVARPSIDGALHVEGNAMHGAKHEAVVLHGVSYDSALKSERYINEEVISDLSKNWNVDLIRIPVSPDEYYGVDKDKAMANVNKCIKLCNENDMYVILDWAINNKADINKSNGLVLDFYKDVFKNNPNNDNFILEICDEPDDNVMWSDIENFCKSVLPEITTIAPNKVILIGTPNYCRNIKDAQNDPIVGYDNLMYSFHFTKNSSMEDKDNFSGAVEAKFPVFLSSFYFSAMYDDKGKVDFQASLDRSVGRIGFFKDNNISFVSMGICGDEQPYSFVKNYELRNYTDLNEYNLTDWGLWMKLVFKGEDPRSIKIPIDWLWIFVYDVRENPWKAVIAAIVVAAVIAAVVLIVKKIRKNNKKKKK